MTEAEIVELFTATGALLRGHFQLRSGLHSDRYFQAALVLQHSAAASRLGAELARRCAGLDAATVISPAVGGIVLGQELARHLGVRAIFAEKDGDSNLVLRRGFCVAAGERVLVAEDVVTRGGRVQQTVDLVRAAGGVVAGVAVMVDRSGGTVTFGVPLHCLARLELTTYEPETCPLCKAGVPLDRPGSK